MPVLQVSFRAIDGTEAHMGWAGVKAVVADRPKNAAGGLGLGLSGGELQALAIGAGFCNQLRFSAHELGIEIASFALDVSLAVDSDANLVSGATIDLHLETVGAEDDRERLLAHATRHSTISNSLAQGFPVAIDANGLKPAP